MMQAQIKDKTSVAYQKLAWEALKKSINGLINKVCICMLHFCGLLGIVGNLVLGDFVKQLEYVLQIACLTLICCVCLPQH